MEETKDSGKQKLWTVKEAAEQLNVTPQMVRALIKNGVLRSYKLGQRSTRISQVHIDEYLKSCEVK